MPTSSIKRLVVLTDQGAKNLVTLMEEWEKNPPKSEESVHYSDADRDEVKELLKQSFSNQTSKNPD